MNSNWKDFLLTDYAASITETDIVFHEGDGNDDGRIFALKHLAVLAVTGSQAGQFLQGQVTCNINDITEQNGRIGALCSAQGKVISTFLLVKTATAYWLVLPEELLDTVKNRLQKYILRADVQLTDLSDSLCLIGLTQQPADAEALFACTQDPVISINLGNRRLLVAEFGQALAVWTEQIRQQGCKPGSSKHWRYMDIVAGIPWLSTETSEQFIPQMLNLDKLGGISFTKGCYTGQEIVARTHYLGKAKRGLFLLAADTPSSPVAYASVADAGGQVVGKVVNAAEHDGLEKMLCVLPVDGNPDWFSLPDYPNHTLTLMDTHG